MRSLLSMKIAGFTEIAEKLRSFPEALGESSLRKSVLAGAVIVRDEVELRAPVQSGVLKGNVIVKHIDEASDGANHQTYYVTVRAGARPEPGQKNSAHDAFYWRWVEDGHRYVPRASRTKSSLKSRRTAAKAMEVEFGTSKVAAHPFIRPAFDSRVADALVAARTKMAECVAAVFAEMSS